MNVRGITIKNFVKRKEKYDKLNKEHMELIVQRSNTMRKSYRELISKSKNKNLFRNRSCSKRKKREIDRKQVT